MLQSSNDDGTLSLRYALCIGIGTYTNLLNRNLRYAVSDATTVAERLADPRRGNFIVRILTEPAQTTRAALDEAVKELLSAPDRQAEDLTILYFSCHGDVNAADNTFCLLPSNATRQAKGMFEPTTLLSIYDFARWFESARAQNIVVLLDVCHSGGAGAALQHFKLDLAAGPNFFFVGAARQDQVTMQSSLLQHGLFTHCLLRAFEQLPTENGWLTISQIQNFVSNELPWFAQEQPTQIQSWSVAVNPNLPLLRNPGYPELCPLPPLWNVPLQRNLFFTGQEDFLSQLASLLQSEQKTALTHPHALSGLGGIGKTQLALEYAYRHRQDYHAVLWGRADTREALISTFVNIASLLDLPEKDEQDQMVIVEAVKAWLMGRSRWLFILDNADELALVKEFIPPAFRGHLLLTTRAQAMGGLARKLEMKVMRPEIGAMLLLRRAGIISSDALLKQASEQELAIAIDISQAVDGLPLALDQAGAYIEETQCGLSGYLTLYQTRHSELLKRRGKYALDYPASVTTTWSLSFEKVRQDNLAAAELLYLCAFLAPDAIPEAIFTQGAAHLGSVLGPTVSDPLLFDEAVGVVRAYSLLSRDSRTQMLSMHRLVQAVLRDSMSAETVHHWKQTAVLTVNMASPDGEDVAQWDACEHWLPHALVCTVWIEQESLTELDAARLLNATASYLMARARYGNVEPLYKRALAICEQQLGANHPDTAMVLNNLALLYQNQGKYAKAEPLYRRALAICEQQLGANHYATALGFHNLAELYRIQGKYEEAETLYKRAIEIREHQLGSEHPITALSLNNLAELYQIQGKYAEAELLCRRALEIRDRGLRANHPDTARSLETLAKLYVDQEKYAEAEPLCRRALEINEQQLGANHPKMATSLNNLAVLYMQQGKYAEAELLVERALAIYEQIETQHQHMAVGLNNLANLYRSRGKYAEAERLCRRALEIKEQQLGANHPDTATSLNNLAKLYQEQEKYAEAEPLYKRALAIYEQIETQHQHTAACLNNLANLYRSQGKYAEAEPLYERALSIQELQLGDGHPRVATGLNDLAAFYHSQSKYEQAEPLHLRALAIREEQLGPGHPDTAASLNNLAALYRNQKRYTEAEPFFRRALSIYEQQPGAPHPETATSLENLAFLYGDQKKYGEAEPLLLRALAIREEQLGPGHPDTVTTLNILANLYQAQGKFGEAEPLLQRILTIKEQQLGSEHPDTAQMLNNLAYLSVMQGKYEQAESLLLRALSICEQQFGATHMATGGVLNTLAILYQNQGRYSEAESLYQRILSICEQHLGPSHPNTQFVRRNYTALLRTMNDDTEVK